MIGINFIKTLVESFEMQNWSSKLLETVNKEMRRSQVGRFFLVKVDHELK